MRYCHSLQTKGQLKSISIARLTWYWMSSAASGLRNLNAIGKALSQLLVNQVHWSAWLGSIHETTLMSRVWVWLARIMSTVPEALFTLEICSDQLGCRSRLWIDSIVHSITDQDVWPKSLKNVELQVWEHLLFSAQSAQSKMSNWRNRPTDYPW